MMMANKNKPKTPFSEKEQVGLWLPRKQAQKLRRLRFPSRFVEDLIHDYGDFSKAPKKKRT